MLHGKGHLPYRGEPKPKFPKPPKRVRNLKQERIAAYREVGVIFGIAIGVPLIGAITYYITKNNILLLIGLVIFVLFSSAGLMVADGLRTIGKFRKDYDFDESFLETEEREDFEETIHFESSEDKTP